MQYTHVPLRQRNAAFAACTVCETGYQIKGSENLTPEQENTQQHKKNILTSIDHPSAIHCQFSEHTHTRAPPSAPRHSHGNSHTTYSRSLPIQHVVSVSEMCGKD